MGYTPNGVAGKRQYAFYARVHNSSTTSPGWGNGPVDGTYTITKTPGGWADATLDSGRIFKFAAPITTEDIFYYIGTCTELTFTTAIGDTVTTTEQREVKLSETEEFSINEMTDTGANYKQLRALSENGNIDILLYAEDTPSESKGISNMTLNVLTNLSEGTNTVQLTSNADLGNVDYNYSPIAVTTS